MTPTEARLVRVLSCEVYSRVCGYFRPVSGWNPGKLAEFVDRKMIPPEQIFSSMKPLDPPKKD